MIQKRSAHNGKHRSWIKQQFFKHFKIIFAPRMFKLTVKNNFKNDSFCQVFPKIAEIALFAIKIKHCISK